MRVIGEVQAAVSVEEFKRAVHVALEDLDADEDAALRFNLAAAQGAVERASNRPIGARVAEFSARLRGPFRRWWFPCAPVREIEAVTLEADLRVLEPPEFRLRFGAEEPQLEFPAGAGFGGEVDLTVRAVVGEDPGAAAVAPLKQAIILLAREWRDAGISISEEGAGVAGERLTYGARALIRQARYARPRICEGL